MHEFHSVTVPLKADIIALGRSKNPYLAEFTEQLDQARRQKGRVYQTYVVGPEKQKFVFVTTSKDLHLGLGQMSELGQYLLAKLLQHEFSGKNFGQLMLHLEKRRDDGSIEVSSTLISICVASGEISFSFSPAH